MKKLFVIFIALVALLSVSGTAYATDSAFGCVVVCEPDMINSYYEMTNNQAIVCQLINDRGLNFILDTYGYSSWSYLPQPLRNQLKAFEFDWRNQTWERVELRYCY